MKLFPHYIIYPMSETGEIPMPARSKVEVKGLEAKHYDLLMNLITLGKYERFIRKAIADLHLQPDDVVMDLGAGTGKNAELMFTYLDARGKLFALEIGEEMRWQLEERKSSHPNLIILNQRIEQPFRLPEPATVAFISFVLHGLEQEERLKVLENVHNNLAEKGRFCILDYAHFNVDEAPWYVRLGIRRLECQLAEEFIGYNWKELLRDYGFEPYSENFYFHNYIRLLCARKK